MGIGETVSDALRFPDMAIHIRDLNDPASLRRKLLFSRDAKLSELTDAIERARADYRQNALDHKEWQRLELFKDDGLIDEFVDRYSRFVQDTNIVDRTLLRSLLSSGVTLFEGAQGVLLDEDYGFHPHTTWSKTTFQNADALLAEAGFTGQVKRLGLLRAYMTRHGAGPLPTEVDVPNFLTDVHNGYGTFQEGFRLGHFDFVLAQYALKAIGGVDELVLTNLDKLRSQQPKICTRYEVSESSILPTVTELPFMTGPDLKFQEGLTKLLFKSRPVYETLADRPSIISRISWTLKTPVTLCSFGPTCERKFPTHCYHIQEATWDS